MSQVERIQAAIKKLERLKAKSTQGEWVRGDRWGVAGVAPEMFGEGRCTYCERMGEPTWVGKRPINGKRMLAHVHESSEPLWDHGIYASRDSGPECVIYDALEYGYMDDVDAELITTMHRTIDAQLEFLRMAIADMSITGDNGTTPGLRTYVTVALELSDAILGD